MVRVTDIKVNYEKGPVAGVTGEMQFSWVIEAQGRDVIQKAYQLQIAQEESFQKPVYDSGTVESNNSAHVFASGFQLKSAQHYYVRVKVECAGTKQNPEWSDFSAPLFLISGLAKAQEWQGKFITAEKPEEKDISKGTYVRKEFQLDGKVAQCYLYATALGIYECYLNGSKVGKDVLTPGWTSYHKHLMYQTYDVTELVKKGENAIGASLGAGWYKGLMGFKSERNNYGTQTAFSCQLMIRYEDGREQVIASDESWKGHDSPVVFAEIYDGEIYDARKEIPDWAMTGCDTESWHEVAVLPFDTNVLEAQTGSRVHELDEVKAKKIFTTPKGETVIDFGQNMSALLHVHATGKAGDVIKLHFFEVLDADGNAYFENLRKAKETLVYTFGKDETITYRPSFTFMGFQYAQILSYPGKPEIQDFIAYAIHSDMGQSGHLTTSNPELNQLMHNILWGLKSNFVDIPTDCPQRNERLGWTGDAQIFCRTATFLMNTYTFYRKWLEDVAADQTPDGGVPHVVPDILTGSQKEDWLVSQGTYAAAAWADVAVINPWNMYLAYGDKVILEKQYASMKGWINFMKEHAKDYIWNFRLQFGDWVALDAKEGSYYGATPNDLTCTAYFAYSTGLFVKTARILGEERDVEEYSALYRNIVRKFKTTFFDQRGEMTAQTQTAHIVALYFGLTPEKYVAQTVERLKELLAKENGHLVTGFVGTPYFCHALSQNGALKQAYELLLKDDFPSWLYQVKQGATTVWEHWDGKKPDGTMWSPDMNSFNHYAYGAIGEWMVRVMGGLEIDEKQAGYKHSILYPRVGGGLSFAEVQYDSVYGEIKVRWEDANPVSEKEGTITVTLQIPVNTTATIRVDGQEILEADGLDFTAEKGTLQAQAGSGKYVITYRK